MNEQLRLACAPARASALQGVSFLPVAALGPLGGESSPGEHVGDAGRDEPFTPLVSLALRPRAQDVRERQCASAVDFLTAFWDERFAAPASTADRETDPLCAVFGFVLSELMENAFKYDHGGDIRVCLGQGPWEWECRVSNQVPSGAVSSLRAQLHELCRAEPGELLRLRAESNARHPERGTLGLGVLLMREYGVRLGWTLQPLSRERVRVEARARLPLLALQARDMRWSASR